MTRTFIAIRFSFFLFFNFEADSFYFTDGIRFSFYVKSASNPGYSFL